MNKLTWLTCCWLVGCLLTHPALAQRTGKAPAQLVFGKSAVADYLYLLFYKNSKSYALDSTLRKQVEALPGLNTLIALPEMAATNGITRYADLYPLARRYYSRPDTLRRPTDKGYKLLSYSRSYPAYAELLRVLQAGEALYPAFEAQWHRAVEPTVNQNLTVWAQQAQNLDVVARFERITRLHFRSRQLRAYCLGLHLAASGNYSPTSLYSEPRTKPNLAWFLGHEGTHVLLNAQEGNDWQHHPQAAQAIALAVQRGCTASTIEETTCLFMQLALSQECGLSDVNRRLSADFTGELSAEDAFKQQLLRTMEQRWAAYKASGQKTLIDFMVEATAAAFGA